MHKLARTLGREVRNRLRKREKQLKRAASLSWNDGETPAYGSNSDWKHEREIAFNAAVNAYQAAGKPLRGILFDTGP